MKQAKSGKRSSPANPAKTPKDYEGYLAGIPEGARGSLNKLRAAILSVMPKGATETISYRIPAIRYEGILLWFAAFSDHCSLFPTAAVIEEFKDELRGLSTSKGTIHFALDKPLPVALIKKIVKARVRQVESKS